MAVHDANSIDAQAAPDRFEKVLQMVPNVQLSSGMQCPAILEALAAWIIYIQQGPAIVVDPMAQRLAEIWHEAGADNIANALCGPGGFFTGSWTASEADFTFIRELLAND